MSRTNGVNLSFLKPPWLGTLQHNVYVCSRESEDLLRVAREPEVDAHLLGRTKLGREASELCLVSNSGIDGLLYTVAQHTEQSKIFRCLKEAL